jgi:hypothetical protein
MLKSRCHWSRYAKPNQSKKNWGKTMTEQEWQACTDPKTMIRFLLGTHSPRVQDVEAFPACKTSDRKLRLFACACYHRIRHMLPDSPAQAAVEVAERFADGTATVGELQEAEARVWGPLDAIEGRWRASQGIEHTALLPTHEALALGLQVVWREAPKAAYYASSNAYLAFAAIANPGAASSDNKFCASQTAEERVQTVLLHCIFDNLFSSVTMAPAVLAWNDSTVVKLAQGIYQERAFDRLPLLADALDKAGCDDDDILNHCRKVGPHVRGCWVVDLILGRE